MMDMDLYSVTSGKLEEFVAETIQPDAAYLDSCGAVVDRLVHFLQNNVPDRIRPARVVKGGSLGKGTAVKGKSDIDLTLILARYSEVEAMIHDMPSILHQLEQYLEKYGHVKVVGKTGHAVQVELSCHSGHTHSVDILPAVDILPNMSEGIKARLGPVYHKLGQRNKKTREFYSASLGPLQIELTKRFPTKLKSLIRLIKYWKKSKLTVTKGSKLPTSYVFELVVLNAWVDAGQPESFNMTRALHAVLNTVVNHRHFKVTFDRSLAYYDTAYPEKSPHIIDPCNPYNDVYHGYFGNAWDWDDVATEASKWLRTQLFSGVSNTKRQW
ncbi:2'-5'-oligoadenylate synthase 1A-like [Mercenaria mercenaria]|uniref:2'-5'-oligoadenylate synthase 1A-like n=1 Tax=Mercenaria mercenaria TaxID=6596 RepID=UPI00234E98C4|nr:2'-5'-oligoadenylate synthase 1A-like [Mercenaria mercenaria]XP_053391607.1 2'-5'-oligoadenylate synthase 1A-like [Mercenaria mercenaria]